MTDAHGKLNDASVPSALPYFAERTDIPRFYLVHTGEKDYEHATLPVRVLPFRKFVKELDLP